MRCVWVSVVSIAFVVWIAPGVSLSDDVPDGGVAGAPDSRAFSEEEETVDDAEVYETEVRGVRIYPTDETTGFGETLVVDEDRKRVADVSEVLSKSVGVQVRSMGGPGAFATVSVRGSTAGQVPVFLDGMQLNIGGFSIVNLGDLTLDTLTQIEVYRGNAPIELGVSGIGGAINLKTVDFDTPKNSFAASYGSWRTWRLLSLFAGKAGKTDVISVVTGSHSNGDFTFYNRKGTLDIADDDGFTRRRNNHHTAYTSLFKLKRRLGHFDVQAMDTLFYKQQGLPGLDLQKEENNAALHTLRNVLMLRAAKTKKQSLLSIDAGHLLMSEQYRDLEGNIGIGHQDNRYQTNGAFLSSVARYPFSEKHVTSCRLAGRYENYRERRARRPSSEQQKPFHRVTAELGAAHDWLPVPLLHIVPALRGGIHYAYFGGGSVPYMLTDFEPTERTDFEFSPSLGLKYDLLPGVQVRVNGGRYFREPDLTELFGDRGAVTGNPELRPEVGYNADAGVKFQWTGNRVVDLLRVDAAWFGSWVQDLISLEPNSQSTSQPVNIDAARILGAELEARLGLFGLLTLSGNYTFLHGINQSDVTYYRNKRLPHRPAHELYGRVEIETPVSSTTLSGWFDVDYASKAYVGQYNTDDFVTMRFLLGAGGRLSLPDTGFSFTFEVKNLLDTLVFKNDKGAWLPMADYDRYPLPGRSFMGTIHWQRP